jgi:MtN3 and saliva related transmembrane protein
MGDWMTSWLIEGIGIAAGIIGVLAWGPQIVEVWKHKRHDGISIPTFSIVAFSLSLWLIYGIAIKSTAMIFANILTLSVIAIIIIGVLKIRKSE